MSEKIGGEKSKWDRLREAEKLVGKKLWYRVEGLGNMVVTVEIVRVRLNFGRFEFLITPCDGGGMKWTTAIWDEENKLLRI